MFEPYADEPSSSDPYAFSAPTPASEPMGMATDDPDAPYDTQPTQSTQEASQGDVQALGPHLWGVLQPCSPALARIDLMKLHRTYSIGRAKDNNVVFPGFKVSNKHCRINWDGSEGRATVTVVDMSSNGTWINGERIGKGQTRLLKEGNEIAFGTPAPQPSNPIEDYRFIYRHLVAGGPAPGSVWAKYDMSTELGKGSFASVMRAICRETGVWYAIKIIQSSKLPRPAGQRSEDGAAAGNGNANGNANGARSPKDMFGREIEIMMQMKHRNICLMKEVFYEPSSINLVLELVEGGDLLDYILKREGLSEEVTRDITYQICDALTYVHSKGIAHRDLKPENVLLTADTPPVVKVADFGLAKAVDSLTMLKTMCGTPSYLAPEVVAQRNAEGYDHVVDSWSVGVIVFSMLTNSSPFIEDVDQPDLKIRILERTIDWPTLGSRYNSAECFDFVRRLLERDPQKRMTLTAAREHAWLKGYVPYCDRSPAELLLDTDGLLGSHALTVAQAAQAAQAELVSAFEHSFNDAILRDRSMGDDDDDGSGSAGDGMALDSDHSHENGTGGGGAEPVSSSASHEFERLGLHANGNGNGQPAPRRYAPRERARPPHSQDSTSSGGVSLIPGAYPKAVRGGAIQREGSRLQRRAQAISQAAEDGRQLPQPSQEMVAQAQWEDRRRAEADAARAGPSGQQQLPRGNKRKSEEDAMEDAADAAGDAGTPNKRGRGGTARGRVVLPGVVQGQGAGHTRRQTRATGAGAGAVDMAIEEEDEEEAAETAGVRRSVRNRRP